MIEARIDDAEVIRTLERALRKAGDLTPLNRRLAGIMADEVEENFEQEGRPKWKPLRSSTIRRRKAKGNWPGKILQVRGRLAHSIQQRATRTEAIVGTNVAYAALQHFGGTTKHAARQRILNFRQAERGKMTHSRPGTGDTFAKAGKAHYSMRVEGKAYTATIPARPFMQLGPGGLQRLLDEARGFLSGL